MGRTSLTIAAILVGMIATVISGPVPAPSQDETLVQKAKEAYVQKLETDLVQAAALGGVAEALRMEQKFEEQILQVAVKTLTRDRGNPKKQARDMQALNELVRRDKRAIELLTNVLGGSTGSDQGDEGTGHAGPPGILSVVSGVVGGSSGGNTEGESGDGGGGSNVLSLLTGVIGSSSGGGGADSDDGGGGSNILSLIPSLLGSSSGGGGDSEDGASGSSLLSVIPNLLGGSSGGGSSGDSDGGGGSNILSLLTGVLGSSSGSNSGDASSGSDSSSSGAFRPLGNIFDQKLNLLSVGGGDDVLKGGTYDDLIGKSGGGDVIGTITNTVSSVLKAKFNVFKSLFSSLTGGLLGRLGGGAAAA